MSPEATHSPAEILEHTGWLRSLARQLVADPNTADDVVQKTLMAALAWEGVPREGLRNWLSGVAKNMARQIGRGESRRSQRQMQAAVPEALPSAGEMVELVESQQLLAAAVLELAEPYRSTIFLRYFEELAPKDIAVRQGLPASTVRVGLKRGLALLRERLEEGAEDGDRHWSLMLLPLVGPSQGEALAAATATVGSGWLAQLAAISGVKAALLVLALVASGALLVFSSGALESSKTNAVVLDAPDSALSTGRQATPRETLSGQRAPSVPTSIPPTPGLTAEACCLVGQIFDPEGLPLAGARVTAVGAHRRSPSILEFDTPEEWRGETTSDANGVYRIPVEAEQPYLIRAAHDSYANAQSSAVFAGELQALAMTEGHDLAITIRQFGTQEALPAVEVHLKSVDPYRVPPAWEVNGTTDEQGFVLFEHLPAGEYHATAELAGHATLTFKGRLVADQDSAQEQQLSPAMSVNGVVLDGATQQPVVGVKVEGPAGSTLSDHRGQFTLEGFNPQAAKPQGVVVRGPDHSPTAQYVRVDPAHGSPFVEIRLPHPVRTFGRVVNAKGQPIAGVRVGHRGRFSPDPSRAERHDGETITDAGGHFELALHYRAQYTIGVQAEGFAMANTRIRNTNPHELSRDLGDLVLHRAGTIRGVVRGRNDDRNTPDTIEVDLLFQGDFRAGPTLLVQVVSVASNGQFLIEDLAPGIYGLTLHGADPSGKRPTVALVRRTIRIAEGANLREIELSPVKPIQGRVALANGGPGNRVRVSVHRTLDEPPIAFTRADASGHFSLVPEGAGPFVIIADDTSLLSNPGMARDIMAGAEGLSLNLEPRSTAFSVHGKLLDMHDHPVQDATLRIIRQATGANLTRDIPIAADGSFEIPNLDDELYTLHAYSPLANHEFTSLFDIQPHGQPITMRMKQLD